MRLVGFRYQTFPTVQFGWPEPKVIANEFQPDRELFWVTPDYWRVLDEARRARPDVVFEGDSCTQFGKYPRYTVERLAASRPDLSKGVKLGVAGWSSAQGLRQFRRDVMGLRPRVVTVYFGWNDHWVALGAPDEQAPPNPALWWVTQHLRVAQAVAATRLALARPPMAGRPNRVDLPAYRNNLETIAALARRAAIVPVFITAPSDHVQGSEPKYLARRHLRRLEELVPLHQSYVAATRDAARESNAVLCDVARQFDDLGPAARHALFRQDGIHLNDEGDRKIAEIVAGCLDRAVPVGAPR